MSKRGKKSKASENEEKYLVEKTENIENKDDWSRGQARDLTYENNSEESDSGECDETKEEEEEKKVKQNNSVNNSSTGGYIVDTTKYRKLNDEKFKDISTNDLLNILMVRGIDGQNHILFADARRLYTRLNFDPFKRQYKPFPRSERGPKRPYNRNLKEGYDKSHKKSISVQRSVHNRYDQ